MKKLPKNKTKLVCTIGPASDSSKMIEKMLQAGMNVARSLTRFRLPVWIIAVTTSLKTCRDLMFSYGVYPILEESQPEDWATRVRDYTKIHGLKGSCFIKAEGP